MIPIKIKILWGVRGEDFNKLWIIKKWHKEKKRSLVAYII